MPQDIEWVFDGTGFHVLQARPITPLAGKNIYSRKLASDMAPGLIKPMYWSTNIQDMARNVFGRIFSEILGPGAADYSRLVAYIHSRVFANVTLFARLFGRLGLPLNLFEVLARDESAIHRRPRLTTGFLRSAGKLVMVALRYGWMVKRAEAFADRHEAAMEGFRLADWSKSDVSEMIRALRGLRSLHGETQWFMWTSAVGMMIRNKMMSRLVSRHAPELDPRDLLAGYLDLKSLEPNEAMLEIAEEIRAGDTGFIELLETGSDADIRSQLSLTGIGRRIIGRFDDFMDRYGHLSRSGTDFTVPPWKENPELIWRSIARMAVASGDSASRSPRLTREEATACVLKRMELPSRLLFRRLLRATVCYLKLRERISFCMSEDAFQMRRVYLSMGEMLAGRDIVALPEDIFYLMYDELENLLEGNMDPLVARERIETRRAAIAADADIDLDDVICGEWVLPKSPTFTDDAGSLHGIAGSAGLVRGRARIVTDPYAPAPDLTKGDILVVPFMDVGWTPLFSNVGGVVAETGGQLSHSAIVARELGLPAVVGVEGATRLIAQGQSITVDGSHGIVHLSHMD
jgi:pyruvate,water dikinase